MVLVGGSTALVLSISGYTPGVTPQPPSTVMRLRLGMVGLPFLALGLFLTALRFYPLGKEEVMALKGKLEVLRCQRAKTQRGR